MKKLAGLAIVIVAAYFAIIAMASPNHPTTKPSVKMQLTANQGDITIIGSPSITPQFINAVLAYWHSPAAGKGKALYDLGIKYNIDPAAALAFFMNESSMGTQGEARYSLSLGNLRCIDNFPCRDGYAWFPSWQAGFDAWYKLLAGPLYIGAGLTTIGQIIHRYAPQADHNDEQNYTSVVEKAITTWRSGKVEL